MDPSLFPLDVRRQLERSQAALDASERKEREIRAKTRAGPEKPDPGPAGRLEDAASVAEPALSGAMGYLMRGKGYTDEYSRKVAAERAEKAQTSVLDEALRGFFLGNPPVLEERKFSDDPAAWAADVLKRAQPRKSQKTENPAAGVETGRRSQNLESSQTEAPKNAALGSADALRPAPSVREL